MFAGMPARNGVTVGAARALRLDRRRRHLLRAGQFLPGPCPEGGPERLVDKLGERYEIAAHRHQEMDGRLADPGAARRARGDPRPPAVRGRSGAGAWSCGSRHRRRGRGQPRHPRHLPAAHGRRHAARQDRFVPRRARQAAHAGRRRFAAAREGPASCTTKSWPVSAGAGRRRRDRARRRQPPAPNASRRCAARRATRCRGSRSPTRRAI